MSNDSWKKGVGDVKQNKGSPSPSEHKDDQARKTYEAAREAEKRRQQDANKRK